MSVTLRPAAGADLPAILDIVNKVILTSTANYNYDPETPEERARWMADKAAAGMPIVVAEYEGRCIGFGTYGRFRDKIGYQYTVEHFVYVAEGFRKQGVGKLLLSELIRLARAQGIHVMIAGIDADNTDSIAFHRPFGFEQVAHFKEIGFKFGRRLDLVFMQMVL